MIETTKKPANNSPQGSRMRCQERMDANRRILIAAPKSSPYYMSGHGPTWWDVMVENNPKLREYDR